MVIIKHCLKKVEYRFPTITDLIAIMYRVNNKNFRVWIIKDLKLDKIKDKLVTLNKCFISLAENV